ncbi:S41 family peptidase [Deinococcus yavapaiensis]|uniref:C-terminal peptidase prc n=1 Tax=Deinococcus yavapaiensis KR-236 TaxID=694435 RepID=A0A318S2L3_9DEIO|nr:S41 family peptidase [Deinococcus yavapaiensis]PYE52692.1 C-terminal peptidase prc [Deinococcus yavapaiensis KR-236]
MLSRLLVTASLLLAPVAFAQPAVVTCPVVAPSPDAAGTHRLSPTLREAVFKDVSDLISRNYIDSAKLKRLNWPNLVDAYWIRTKAASDDAEFYRLLRELVGKLDDKHARFESSIEIDDFTARINNQQTWGGVGIIVKGPRTDRGGLVIDKLVPGGPALTAALRPGEELVKADGANCPTVERIRGPVGSTVRLTVRSLDGRERDVNLKRTQVQYRAEPVVERLAFASDIVYLHLDDFAVRGIGAQAVKRLVQVVGRAPVKGVVVDLRWNTGGVDEEAQPVLGNFLSGKYGEFRDRTGAAVDQVVAGGPLLGALKNVPVAVLVNEDTFSWGEAMSGVLQHLRGATVIGRPTGGGLEPTQTFALQDGSRVWVTNRLFHYPDGVHPPRIVPDIAMDTRWPAPRLAEDAAVRKAVDVLRGKK